MKKFVLAILLVTTSLFGFSQAHFGIRGGANISDITQIDHTFKTDFYGGIALSVMFGEKYGIQPELTYSKQGAKGNPISSNSFESFDIDLEYLSLSLVNKMILVKKLYLLVGPSIDIKIYENYATSPEVDYYLRHEPEGDFSFIGGLSFDVSKNITLEGRVKHGIIQPQLFKNNGSRNLNRVFQIGVLYKFNYR